MAAIGSTHLVGPNTLKTAENIRKNTYIKAYHISQFIQIILVLLITSGIPQHI